MKDKMSGWILGCVLMCVLSSVSGTGTPNIVLFLADDLGMGDLGCFGNTTLRTPNIDSIARQGATLTHHLTAASVCTPSRAAFLTGRYPIRMGMVPTHIVRVNMFVAATAGMPSEEITVAELLKEQGYKTAYVGKWHLGLHSSNEKDFKHHPMNQGFDHFYGLPLTNLKDFGNDGETVVLARMPYFFKLLGAISIGAVFVLSFLRRTKRSGCFSTFILTLLIVLPPLIYVFCRNLKVMNSILMRDYEVVEQPVQLFNNFTQKLTQEGVEFLEARAVDKSPFLLAVPWVQVHTVMHTSPEFAGRSQHGPYGDNVEELDWSVGEIMNALKRLGMVDNTFVYFSSDNGGHSDERDLNGNVCGGWNGIYRGGKSQGGMDGGIRVPTVAMFPGVIPAGLRVDSPTSNMDVLPTVAELTGASLPSDRVIDGRSMLSVLSGQTKTATHDVLFHYCGTDIHAARYSPKDSDDIWKVHLATPNWLPGTEGCGYICDCYGSSAVTWHNPPIMYNIAKDPRENHRLDVTEAKYEKIWEYIRSQIQEHTSGMEDAPNMYSIPRMLPRPWLQPCCNFPYCSCTDQKYNKP